VPQGKAGSIGLGRVIKEVMNLFSRTYSVLHLCTCTDMVIAVIFCFFKMKMQRETDATGLRTALPAQLSYPVVVGSTACSSLYRPVRYCMRACCSRPANSEQYWYSTLHSSIRYRKYTYHCVWYCTGATTAVAAQIPLRAHQPGTLDARQATRQTATATAKSNSYNTHITLHFSFLTLRRQN
jgi:hypothetical protein